MSLFQNQLLDSIIFRIHNKYCLCTWNHMYTNIQRLNLNFGHTYQEPEFDGGINDGKTIPLVPNHQFSQQFIIKFFEDKGTLLRSIGKVGGGQAVDCVMGMLAWQAFRSNADIKDGENFYTKSALEFSLNPFL